MSQLKARTIDEAPKPARGWHIVAIFIAIVVAGGAFIVYYS